MKQKNFANKINYFFIETSALADSNVATAFETILKEIYRQISRKIVSVGENSSFTPGQGQSIVLTEENVTPQQTTESSKKCCGS